MTTWLSVFPAPSMSLGEGHLQIPLEKIMILCNTFQNFFFPLDSSLMHKCTRRRGKAWSTSHFLHSASTQHLMIWTCLPWLHCFPVAICPNLLACPLYSELVHSSQAFRRQGIPGGRSLQMSPRHFSRPLNSLMLPGQAPSSKRNTAFEHANNMPESSSTPDMRFPSHRKSGPSLVGDIFQGPWLPGMWCASFGLHAFPEIHGNILWGFHI